MKVQRKWFGVESIVLLFGLVVLLVVNGSISTRVQEVVRAQSEIAALVQNAREVEGTLLAVSLAVARRGDFEQTRSYQDWRRFEQAWNASAAEIDAVNQNLTLPVREGSPQLAKLTLVRVLSDLSFAMDSLRPRTRENGGPLPSARVSTVEILSPLYDSYRSHATALDRLLGEEREKLQREIEGSYLLGALSLVVAVVFFGLAYAFLQVQIFRSRSYAAHWKDETRRAQKAERISGEFLANMSHEIRTPMTAILGFGELLRTVVSSPKAQTYLNGIETSGKVLLTLINDILDLSKVEAGLLVLEATPSSPRQLVSEIEQIFFSMAQKKGLSFQVAVDERVPQRCRFDEVRVRQVLLNLVGNAVKYTEKGFVRVTVAVSSDGSRIQFDVADSGIGIPKEDWKLVFQPFRQVESNKTRRFGGTGLGLSISARLASLMGGTIDLRSELGKGSVFTFCFPLEAVEGAAQSKPVETLSPALVSLTEGTVLLVDDEPHNLTIMKEFLSGHSIQVLQASDGNEAMVLLEEVPIDVLVTDIQMPGVSGVELITQARQKARYRNLPVVVVTASALRKELEEQLAVPRTILTKPFQRATFLEALSCYLPHERCERPRDQGVERSALDPISPRDRLGLAQSVGTTLAPRLREAVADSSIDGFVDFALFLEEEGHRWSAPRLVSAAEAIRKAADDLDIAALQEVARGLEKHFESLTASPVEE